ncbi:MAG: signal peptidase II [Candidatus Aminicenantes bacterium]
MKKRLFYFLFILFVVMVDQGSKLFILTELPVYSRINVIPGFFNLTHIHNRGAIFGFLSQTESQSVYYLLMLASLMALGLVAYYFFKTSPQERFLQISLSLIIAGALGNLLDRIFRGYVIDFLDFYIKKWHWPSFNVADASVSMGAVFLIAVLIFKRK